MKNAGLGRGLGALLGDAAIKPNAENSTMELRITEVEPNADQPRKAFGQEALAELTDSIRQHGIITPMLVRKMSSGTYQIIAGERRWRAARMAGLTTVPAVIIEADDRKATELALIENLQREDLNAVEVAEGYKVLADEYGLTQEEISERVGRSRPAVANAIRLLTLPQSVQELVQTGKLSEGLARSLLPLDNSRTAEALAERLAEGNTTVRQAEALVKKMLNEPKTPLPKPLRHVDQYEQDLAQHWGRKVTVNAGTKRGKLEFEYYDAKDLEDLVKRLLG